MLARLNHSRCIVIMQKSAFVIVVVSGDIGLYILLLSLDIKLLSELWQAAYRIEVCT